MTNRAPCQACLTSYIRYSSIFRSGPPPARRRALQPSLRAGADLFSETSRASDRSPVGTEFRRRIELHLYPDARDIDETEPQRVKWHHTLARLARAGKANRAMATLEAMIRQGIYPGPAACHALILAHAKAEDPEGALLVLRLMQAAGNGRFCISVGWCWMGASATQETTRSGAGRVPR